VTQLGKRYLAVNNKEQWRIFNQGDSLISSRANGVCGTLVICVFGHL